MPMFPIRGLSRPPPFPWSRINNASITPRIIWITKKAIFIVCYLNSQFSNELNISIRNDTKTSDQKKVKRILGIVKPEKVRPGKTKLEMLKPVTKTVTKYKTMTLIIQRKAPSVSRLIGIKSRLRTGLINKLKMVSKTDAQKRVTKLFEKLIAPVSFAMAKRQKKLMKILRNKLFMGIFPLSEQYHFLFPSCKNFFLEIPVKKLQLTRRTPLR